MPSPEPMLAGFFGRIVRLIAESLPNAAAVIAVHDTYLSNSNYRDATGFLESRITLPLIPTAAGLGQIVALRARRGLKTGEHVVLNDIIDDSALQRLYGNYQAAGPSLRTNSRSRTDRWRTHATKILKSSPRATSTRRSPTESSRFAQS